ncbi:MAG TPA: hypothetical protein VGN57_01210 [Pirellulaceae bacterium]|jgi:hypothetical protein|nr:hypothetical protein [Pirellulaceae bacterium]
MPLSRDRDLPEPSPRYFSRGTQLQLLAVLAAIAAVFAIGTEATRPFWSQWGLADPLPPPLTAAQIEEMQTPVTENALRANWVFPPERLRRLDNDSEGPRGVDAEIDRRWRNVIDDLTLDQRFELLNVLLAATGERPSPLPTASAEAPEEPVAAAEPPGRLSPAMLAALRDGWERQQADLSDMLARADGGETTEEGRRLIESVRSRAAQQLAAIEGKRSSANGAEDDARLLLSPEERAAALAPVLRAWDRAALNAVADATATGDPRDFALWYRLFDRLSHVPEEALREAAGDSIAVAALARQPHAHRGELFKLVGTARGGKSVKAPANPLGIERYYVIWVQPDDDRDVLVAVYSLSKPEGFPDLPEQIDLARFAYRVEASVYFLKKIAYESKSTISVSPLVLARSFRFEPPQPEVAAEPPSLTALAIGMGLATVVGVGVVAYIYIKTRTGSQDLEAMPERIDESALRKRFVESP